MKSIVLTTAAVAALFVAPAVAEVEQAGALTYKELKQEYPTLTKKTFEMVDVNKDGVADMEEIDQAEQSDVLEAQSMMDKS